MPGEFARVRVRFLLENIGEVEGEFVRYLAPRTIEALTKSMPIDGRLSVWKEEVYFETPVKVGSEKPRARVDTGAIAYWPMGAAICIFYGKSQPYSPVNMLGKVTKNLALFMQAKQGSRVRVERV